MDVLGIGWRMQGIGISRETDIGARQFLSGNVKNAAKEWFLAVSKKSIKPVESALRIFIDSIWIRLPLRVNAAGKL